jgi:hypothetical protein
MLLESAVLIGMHGYLYLSNTQMTGTYGTEIYTTSSNTFNNGTTFSWHPYKWLENSFSADKYPARVWVNDPRDKALFDSSFVLGNTFRISSDLKKEQDLANNINKWIHNNNVGWEAYAEVGNEGNSGSFWHTDYKHGAVEYCFLDQNCYWWAQKMLKDQGLINPYNPFQLANWFINSSNLGTGTTLIPTYSIYRGIGTSIYSVGNFFSSIYARILSLVTYHETEVQYNNWDGVIEPPF